MDVTPITVGDTLDLETRAGTLTVQVRSVNKRNWSRVGNATDQAGQAYFVKQFMDRSGRPSRGLMNEERRSAAIASRLYTDLLVMQPLGQAEKECVLAYPFLEFIPLEHLLVKSAGDALHASASRWAMSVIYPRISPVSRGSSSTEIPAFKGIDFSNVGINDSDRLVLFDLGPMVSWPVARVAARMIVTAAYARWKRNVRTMLKGPPERLIETLCDALGPHLDDTHVRSELAREYRLRLETLTTGAWHRRFTVHTGGRLLGYRYARAAAKRTLRQVDRSSAVPHSQ